MSLSQLKPRPPVVIRESDADTLYALAIDAMLRAPRLAAMMLEELGRSTVEPDEVVPATVAGLGSVVRFVDGFTGATSTVTLVHPADADGPSGRVSVLTPLGAGLLGLAQGQSILWPDRLGHERLLRVVEVGGCV